MDNNAELAAALGKLLEQSGWMLACAESCTGGLLAAAMTETPGSSAWFDRGFVTYSNAAKVEHLRVSEDTLEHFGAVSEETAMEMASGALAASSRAQLAVSTTGIAGPDGATPGKPVGMVCFGFAHRTSGGVSTRAMTRIFEGDRAAIRRAAVAFAIRTAIDLSAPQD
ncbi:CinA family protein [Allopusillimonas soli]|nr:CinA family protein [Allopusillimonas soli]